ncbi:hypothetical protein SESBI_02070 [Sesbania bispinosa]|nr:hypothetical protein SESBI_02070 [Sesbania bispinosa]
MEKLSYLLRDATDNRIQLKVEKKKGSNRMKHRKKRLSEKERSGYKAQASPDTNGLVEVQFDKQKRGIIRG